MRIMRPGRMVTALALFSLLALVPAQAYASTLEDKKNEWAFSLSSIDDDFGTFTVYELQWGYIFSGGRFELGADLMGFSDDPDFGSSFEASTLGPIFTWNWLPRSERVTGYASVTVAAVGGDLEDFFDGYTSVALGAKIFVGNSAAIRAFVTADTFVGKDQFEDEDQSRFVISIAMYSH